MTGPRARGTLLLALLMALALSGCVSLPDTGQVQTRARQAQESQSDAPFDYTPSGPRPGASPVEIVDGFLQAMTATPVTMQYAAMFLSDEARGNWEPESGTVVYGSESHGMTGRSVRVSLGETIRLDGRGEWLGNTSGGKDVAYDLELVRDKGQWRISNPPNQLIIPQAHFESRFQQYFLYFFDKSAQVLVPEPVYLPRGETAPTVLVRGLLQGPDQDLLGAERTFLPPGTELEVSAPVQPDGTVVVPLSDEVLDLDGEDLEHALGQLGWTLGQVPGVERMRITVDGSPLDILDRGAEQDVRAWPEYDPSVNWASQELFGIRDGRVVNLVGDEERRIAGLFGSESYGLRSIAVDLPAEQVAGVSADGTTVLTAPRSRDVGEVPTSASAHVMYSGGTDVLKPAWDLYGQLWLVDRTSSGAVLSVVRKGNVETLSVPGITGEDITAFVVSRDGTRLVAAVNDKSSDRLVISRIMRTDQGAVRRLTRATDLPVGAIQVDEIRDLAWRSPGSVALLAGPMPGLSQVIVVLIDGSSALGDVASNAELFRDEALHIVTSPVPGASLYVGTRNGQLFQLAANGRWTGTSIKGGLVSPTFVG
ncbi:MAG TPA: LpqB family beta-propeller domain-containing protein [Nocardioidaceae bacterium]|nr:LpqB family beta-propeller domain-containing protein [Nocardioidaceae bacterium]